MTPSQKKYLRMLKRSSFFIPSSGKKMCRHIRNDIESYLAEHESATFDDLCAEFGHPKDHINQYMENLSTAEKDTLNRSLRLFKFLMVLSIAFLTALCVYLGISLYNIYFLHRVNINTDTHISEEDIQIPYFSPKEIREYSDIFLSNDPSYKFKNVKKTIDIKDSSGNIVCSLTLRATFKYNGTNSVCCGSSTKKRILNEDWHFGECSHTNTYDKVIARYTYYFKTVENSFSDSTSISCDENGNIY